MSETSQNQQPHKLFSRAYFKESVSDWYYIVSDELRTIFTDQGVLIFCVLVPLLYPLLYSFIYTNEVIHEVPTVVVDDCHSARSRKYIREVDATPQIKIVSQDVNMAEARQRIKHRDAYGIIHIPASFDKDLADMKQTYVSIYVDMSGMLYYSALLTANTNVSLAMNSDIKVQRKPGTTDEEDIITQQPIKYEAVDIYNPQNGYASALIAAVLILILQQTLVLGVGLSAGTARERNSYSELLPINRHYNGLLRIVFGKAAAFILIYLWNVVYLLGVVPHIFELPQLASMANIWFIGIPLTLACTFFAMTCSVLIRQREAAFMIIVFMSVPLMFISGISWPSSNIPEFWKLVGKIFPSTYGINAYVKVNNMGATLQNIQNEVYSLWILSVIYFGTTLLVYQNNIRAAAKRFEAQKESLKKKMEERKKSKTAE